MNDPEPGAPVAALQPPALSAAPPRRYRADVLLGLACLLAAAGATWAASGRLEHLLDYGAMDLWFEADVPRVFDDMISRWTDHYRSALHPLFSLMVFPFVFVLRKAFHLEAWTAVRVVLAGQAGTWLALLFAVLRTVGCRRSDALLFTLVGATSAGAMFFSVIPETHPLGSVTALAALLVVAVSARRAVPEAADVAASAATLAVTVTNWMIGLAAVVVRRPWRRSAQISANALVVVVLLWVVEKRFIPSTVFFLGNPAEKAQIFAPEGRGPLRGLTSAVLNTMVMPEIAVVDRPSSGVYPIMVTNPSPPVPKGPWGRTAIALWAAQLLLGLWALLTMRGAGPLRGFLALALAGQVALYTSFGNETFLYAPMLLPLFVTTVALATLTRLRVAAVAVAAALVVSNTVHNVIAWRRAADFLTAFAPMSHDLRIAHARRPGDPWPSRLDRASVIRLPGRRDLETGLTGPGGTFHPGLGEFSVAFWTLDADGAPLASSDMAPFLNATHRLLPHPDSAVRGVEVTTPAYRATWTIAGERRWQLDLDAAADARLALVVRSVGYTGGPIRRLEWDGRRLLVNERWSLSTDAADVRAFLVDEGIAGWTTARPDAPWRVVVNGWGAARLELARPGRYHFVVEDTQPDGPVDRFLTTLPSTPGAIRMLQPPTGEAGGGAAVPAVTP